MENQNEDKMPKTNSSIERALNILAYLAQRSLGASAIEICHSLKINKATTYNILRTLEANQYVVRQTTGKYQLTSKLYELGTSYYHNNPLVLAFNNSIGLLVKKHPCNISLSTLGTENHGTVLAMLGNPDFEYIPVALPGTSFPLHASSMGKVILAFSSGDIRAKYLGQKSFLKMTPMTITKPTDLAAELEEIVNKGYSFDNEEVAFDICCVGAPVFGKSQNLLAAVSLSGRKKYILNHKDEVIYSTCLLGKKMSNILINAI